MRTTRALVCIGLFGAILASQAQEVQILSLSRNGVITWTNTSLNATCRVEWASSVEGPWHSSWESLVGIVPTNGITIREVPMFYRVVSVPFPSFHTLVSPAQTMALLDAHGTDPFFVTIDVRTPSEFAGGHVRGAINIDRYSATFQQQLEALNRHKTYLVYCGVGGRSAYATALMKQLGFRYLYELQGGISAFQQAPGASAYIVH